MRYLLATASLCLLSALSVHAPASAAPVLSAPEKLPDACWNTLHSFDGPLTVYRVVNPKVSPNDPLVIDFSVRGGNAAFHVKFAEGLDSRIRKQFVRSPGGLFVVFVEPGSVVPRTNNDTVLDYFVIANGADQNGDPICQNVSDTNWLPAESRPHMPKMVQKQMAMVKERKIEATAKAFEEWTKKSDVELANYRNYTSQKMIDTCGGDYVINHMHPLTIGYKVTGGESVAGTGRFFFTVEGGPEGFRYEFNESELTLVVKSMLNALGKQAATIPETEQREKLFAVFGPPEMGQKAGNVSIMLVKSLDLPSKGCIPMTGLQTTYLAPQNMPAKVREERTRPEAAGVSIQVKN